MGNIRTTENDKDFIKKFFSSKVFEKSACILLEEVI